MNLELKDIYGVWRHVHNNITTDFRIRFYDDKNGKGLSFFTIYGKDDKGKPFNYEWQGAIIAIVDTGDSTFNIKVDHMKFTEDRFEFQNLKVWMLTDDIMTLELGNGQKVDFQKIS